MKGAECGRLSAGKLELCHICNNTRCALRAHQQWFIHELTDLLDVLVHRGHAPRCICHKIAPASTRTCTHLHAPCHGWARTGTHGHAQTTHWRAPNTHWHAPTTTLARISCAQFS
ncbi:hypothetical protein LshimejAT787_1202380 [Lyophyllum shimeji]|uniref:Uncharacterized protein n=1 Tax=Lyophyllum shimeji TaxID=47721 RepID=A0A9P3UPH9_LYOSH|nr:hypothetical protein LshimejAT787_1202380 [Lyophyllum shimeji]